MITHALILAFAPQVTVEHAKLHPDTAFLYAELPDIRTALGAYEKAPVAQMVRDEEVRKAVYGAFESFDIDLDEQLAWLGSRLGLPADRAQSPVSAAIDYFARLRSASVSLSFVPNDSSAPLQASGTTIAELAELAAHVEAFRAENGELPATLADLDVAQKLRTDAWGHAYAYERSTDGASFSLASRGADGQPGGEGAAADIEHGKEDEAGKRIVAALSTQLGVLAVLSFDQAEHAQWAHGLFVLGTAKAHLKAAPRAEVTYRGAKGTLERWSGDSEIQFPLWTILTDRDFVVGAGVVTPEGAAALAAGQGTSVAALPKFATLPKLLPAAQGVAIGRAFMQAEGMLQLAYQGGPQTEALRDLLERSGGETYARMHLVGDRFVSELVTTPCTNDYFGKSMGQTPVPPELWKCIPDDAIAFYATSIDGAQLYKELLIALSAEGNDLESRIRELEEKHGISLERDLFANLGGGAVGYLLEIKGFPPGMAAIADLKDPEAFTRGMGALLKLVSEQGDVPFTIKSSPYKYKGVECPKWTFSFDTSGGDGGFAGPMAPTPTVAVVKNRVVMTLFSVRATKEIKRLLGEEGAQHPLLENASRPPANATVVGYMDWAEFLAGTYRTALGFASLAGGLMGGEAKLDVTKLPDVKLFTRFFKPTILYSRPLEQGTYTRLESSFGPETWAAFLGGIVAGVVAANAEELEPPGGDAHGDAATPEDEPAAPPIEETSTRVALASIQTAIAVYRADAGRLPAALEDLARPTKSYPRGFFNGGALPKDGWGRDYRYAPAQDGKTYRLWSVGANGVDDGGSGDDVSVD